MKGLLAIGAAGGLSAAALATAAALYQLPPERPVNLPPGPGMELTAAHCSACHSLDYLTTQPPGLGADLWKKSVDKMVTIHGADIPAADRTIIEAYLARAFP